VRCIILLIALLKSLVFGLLELLDSMLNQDTALQQWNTVFVDVPSSCSIEVQVQKLLCCVFVAESVQDECSVKTFATAISKSTITSAVLGNLDQLWAHLAFEGPI
jgi:hypothetical protein